MVVNLLTVTDYIKLILKKKKWTNVRLCQELNKIESKLGDSKTSPQNITNYLNGYHDMRPKWLAKVEKALDLQQGTLINMVMPPSSREAQKELKELIKKVGEIN